MILRRITQHVREQNWTAIGIDFVIVVVGVFIGIQVSNWNAARVDREAEARYLRDLREDIREDHLDIVAVIESANARVLAVNSILRDALGEAPPDSLRIPTGSLSTIGTRAIPLPEGPPPAPETAPLLWATINFTRVVNANQSGYDALVNSGDIRLLRDHDLVRALQAYYNLFEGLERVQERQFRAAWEAVVAAGRRAGFSPLGPVEPEALAERARTDPAFAATLREAREMAVLHASFASGLEDRADELLSMIPPASR
ncbi:hypothetical protein [Rubrivirga sp. IMCC45206]|uniref:hypothetical protein n=1 Tax=Rubrivirga sp. IMCC45206 TaxID=3391614 RepID=UPI00398FECD8